VMSQNRFEGKELTAAALLLGALGVLLVIGGLLTAVGGLLGLFDARKAA